MDYRLLISIEVVEFIDRLPARTKRALRSAIHAIGRDPRGKSDAEDRDNLGRLVHVAVVGDYALMYWIDDADRQIKILDIHAADR